MTVLIAAHHKVWKSLQICMSMSCHGVHLFSGRVPGSCGYAAVLCYHMPEYHCLGHSHYHCLMLFDGSPC